jgi:hypothetical protein
VDLKAYFKFVPVGGFDWGNKIFLQTKKTIFYGA